MICLSIESSCDETAVAIIKDKREVLANIVSTQISIILELHMDQVLLERYLLV